MRFNHQIHDLDKVLFNSPSDRSIASSTMGSFGRMGGWGRNPLPTGPRPRRAARSRGLGHSWRGAKRALQGDDVGESGASQTGVPLGRHAAPAPYGLEALWKCHHRDASIDCRARRNRASARSGLFACALRPRGFRAQVGVCGLIRMGV